MRCSRIPLVLPMIFIFCGCGSSDRSAVASRAKRFAADSGLPLERTLKLADVEGTSIDLLLIPPPIDGTVSADSRIARGFYMSRYEITQAQYAEIMQANPSTFMGRDWPVNGPTFQEAKSFCEHLSKKVGETVRLPTASEWEYACRAGSRDAYYGGPNESDLDRVGWFKANAKGQPRPVGLKETNAWGLADMHGNVWEWSMDKVAPPPNAKEGETSKRLLCGGSWMDDAHFCTSDSRIPVEESFVNSNIGFRIVVDLPQKH